MIKTESQKVPSFFYRLLKRAAKENKNLLRRRKDILNIFAKGPVATDNLETVDNEGQYEVDACLNP